MGLSAFIRENAAAIIEDWKNFARSHIAAAGHMEHKRLRNHISDLLTFIANDMDSAQTEPEQLKKAKGEGAKGRHHDADSAAESHAELRFVEGFEATDLMAEFRALRASIVRLWEGKRSRTDADYQELVRFNEAVDQILSEAFCRYNARLNHARTLFLGTLVHDLRNPLNAVSQSAELLKLIGPTEEKQKKIIDQISCSTARLSKLVSNLIDTIRVKLGKGIPISPSQMDLRMTVGQAVDEIQAAHPDSKISVEATGNLKGEWDSLRMEQVLSNLIGNAIQHGGKNEEIKVTAKGDSEKVLLSVHNGGSPIPAAALSTIFDPLTRGDSENPPIAGASLGLGLFITKKIIDAHGGDIEVASNEEEGTTFTAWIPRVSPPTHVS